MLVGDKDVLNSAAKAIEMGLTQLREFDDKNLAVTEQVRKDVKIIHDDYEAMKHEIHKALMESCLLYTSIILMTITGVNQSWLLKY